MQQTITVGCLLIRQSVEKICKRACRARQSAWVAQNTLTSLTHSSNILHLSIPHWLNRWALCQSPARTCARLATPCDGAVDVGTAAGEDKPGVDDDCPLPDHGINTDVQRASHPREIYPSASPSPPDTSL